MAGMVRFDWADPLLLDEQLSDEERLIRDTARGFARTGCCPASSRRSPTSIPTPASSARWASSACSA